MRATRYLCSIAGLLAIGAAVYAGQPSTQPSGEIYVGGHVARPGVYSITGHPMDVLKAIDQAGPTLPPTIMKFQLFIPSFRKSSNESLDSIHSARSKTFRRNQCNWSRVIK